MNALCLYADPVFRIVACTVGTASPHLWTCPGCSRNWCHHHQEGPGAMCGSCMMRIGGLTAIASALEAKCEQACAHGQPCSCDLPSNGVGRDAK